MSARDLPQNRSLAESQEARSIPDRAARAPGELLDNLRLRLSLLPDNHPSAARDPAPERERGDRRQPREPGAGTREGGAGTPEGGADSAGSGSAGAPPDRDRSDGPARDRSDGLARDRSDPPQDDPGEREEDEPAGRADDSASAGGGSLADLIKAVREAGDALSPSGADMNTLGEFGLFAGSGSADPYRPWFMDGEPGTPWFAEDS
jgi:hypothetical protein